jgi:ABC-type multidrug transport system fused ATPase/permease subunit
MQIAGAVLESVVVVLVAPLAQAAATGVTRINRQLGPFDATASPTGLVALGFLALVALTTVRLVAVRHQASMVARRERDEIARFADALTAAPWETVQSDPPGYVTNVGGYTRSSADLLTSVIALTRSAFSVVFLVAAAALVAPLIALAMIVVGAVLATAVAPAVRRSRQANERAVAANVEVGQRWVEAAELGASARVMGVQGGLSRRVIDASEAAVVERRRAVIASGSIQPVYQAAGLGIVFAALAYSFRNDVDVPALGAVALLLLRSLAYLQGTQSSYQRIVDIVPAVDLVDRTIRRYRAASDAPGTVRIDRIESVELRNVSFRFADADHRDGAAIDDLSLSLRAGERVGVIGPSGAGKTTLAHLMLGLRSPTSGVVAINGVPRADVAPADLARAVAFVPQSAPLFTASVAANVAFMRDLPAAQIGEALDAAGLRTFVDALPEGQDTLIGPGARDVSGGQRQRIGIARALAARPTLVVLDEPTSALDVDAEQWVTETLGSLAADTIAVVIAHRLSTLRCCDRVIVLDRGGIAADGSHASLMAGNEFYRRAIEAGVLIEERSAGDPP